MLTLFFSDLMPYNSFFYRIGVTFAAKLNVTEYVVRECDFRN
ncbi:hypothetical protein EV198_0985 [Roseivirga ehrenbergii]|nr:hypothetical protein EV198_0985 [Roseivirga ehrenbergii]